MDFGCSEYSNLLAEFTRIPEGVRYTSFALTVTTCVLGLAGNAIVIFVTGFLLKKHESKIWFLNLALADFVFSLCLPLFAVGLFTGNWPLGEHLCNVHNYISTCNMYASIFIITALTIDRVLSVVVPIWHRKFISRRVRSWTCVILWVITGLLSIPVVIANEGFFYGSTVQCRMVHAASTNIVIYDEERFYDSQSIMGTVTIRREWKTNRGWAGSSSQTVLPTKCVHEIFSSAFSTGAIPISFLVIGYFIPLTVILCSNVVIIVKGFQSHAMKSPKLFRVVTAVITFFFLTWTPLITAQITAMAALRGGNLRLPVRLYRLMPLLCSIAYTNSCINPFIYVFVGSHVRKAIRDFLGRRGRDLSRS
ncbi:hypothetical protein GDO86_013836 [Hymenochirus boettgeri]|uniref:G-protein coupled receptors family 1 profile domain-containing protein n=1 Tax=Hymenochirus boettgeri TaxID=247094 RepID=A0A8T2JLH3_9PIPI|nr:hypothetical protein GDO86_013836 [Hymenochirus boettgeri]